MRSAMNEMETVTEFLESAGAAALEVQRLHSRMDDLARRRSRLRIRRGAVAKKLTRMLAAERQRELELVKREMEMHARVEEFIARIQNVKYRTILRRRYLDPGMTWREIRKRLEKDGIIYSQRHLIRLHAQALEAAGKLWEEEREGGADKKRR